VGIKRVDEESEMMGVPKLRVVFEDTCASAWALNKISAIEIKILVFMCAIFGS
jgi:hypothetical protein